MHPPLSRPHPSCQDVIVALRACHEENSFAKFFGACNSQKKSLDECFLKEKKDKQAANGAKARASRAKFEKKLAEKK
jgi:COX assembly mitochondrial protein 2